MRSARRLEKASADLVSLSERIDTTSAAGKMVFRMLAVLAEFERDLVSERTRGALAHMAAQGLRTGEIPYGFRLAADRAHLEGLASERETLADVRRLRAEGVTWRAIAEGLNARGLRTKKGKGWTWRNVQKIAA